jgi:hypothetical protein
MTKNPWTVKRLVVAPLVHYYGANRADVLGFSCVGALEVGTGLSTVIRDDDVGAGWRH